MDKRALAGVVLVVLGYWGVSTLRSLSSPEGRMKLPAEELEAQRTMERSPANAPVTEIRSIPKADIPPPPPETKPPVIFEAQAELTAYAQLKTKVLPSESEKKERARILNDSRVIGSVSKRLLQIPPLSLGEQVAAIDLLIEALKKGDKNAAEEAMREIVSDKQVEDVKLPQEVREQLAGIKAEILYNWAAIEPNQQSDIARRLPGPASEKIWRNVQDTFANHIAESEAEIGR